MPTQTASEVRRDIEQTLGTFPSWLAQVPDHQLSGAWSEMKDFEMSEETALPLKVKELIGLGVASQIPCDYCTHIHTEAAKMAGATDREIREAVYMASITRKYSTILNGAQQDIGKFREETGRIRQHLEQAASRGPSGGRR